MLIQNFEAVNCVSCQNSLIGIVEASNTPNKREAIRAQKAQKKEEAKKIIHSLRPITPTAIEPLKECWFLFNKKCYLF
jgi:hypothetical protein